MHSEYSPIWLIAADVLFYYYFSVRMTGVDWPHRWAHVSKILTRPGPFAHPDFEACPEVGHINNGDNNNNYMYYYNINIFNICSVINNNKTNIVPISSKRIRAQSHP